MNCCGKTVKSTCGKKVASVCVDYTGGLYTGSPLDVCNDISVQDVIEDINSVMTTYLASADLSGLGTGCITYTKETDGNILIKNALSAMDSKICELQTAMGYTTDNCDSCPNPCSPIFDLPIDCLNLDLGTLEDPCGNPITTFKELLQAMITQINTNI